MEIKGIKYVGPILDGSGYAKACRENIKALLSVGVNLTLAPISFETIRTDLEEEGFNLKELINKEIDYNIVLIHTTPEFWEKYREEDKINCGFTIWETTKLHPSWKDYINNNVEKVLVGCEWNVDVFKDSGVTLPIGVVPHPIEIPKDDVVSYNINGVDDDTFVFYSIYQWVERKDPVSALKAYWYAFQNNENVALVLKTYRSDYSDQEKEAIRVTLNRMKDIMPMPTYPKIYLIPDLLTDNEINGLHKRGDCYLSTDRGEGFGLSGAQAGSFGNPIMVTGFGGALEYAKEDNSYLIDSSLNPVFGQPWSPWYLGVQLWAQADIHHCSKLLRHVYENQEEAKQKGLKLQKFIKDNLSHEIIGNKIVKEIEML